MVDDLKRGMLVILSGKEQDRLEVPKDRPWLILQTDVRDGGHNATILACPITDKLRDTGVVKPERAGDVPLVNGTDIGNGRCLQKNSLVRLGELRPVRVAEINEIRGMLLASDMMFVSASLRDLLFEPDDPVYGWREETATPIQPIQPVITARPSEPFIGKSPEPLQKLPRKKK